MAKRFNQVEMKAYNEAFDVYKAFMNGSHMEGNPYRRGTRKHAAWATGFEEAREQYVTRRNAYYYETRNDC
jgi:hypothetical protein